MLHCSGPAFLPPLLLTGGCRGGVGVRACACACACACADEGKPGRGLAPRSWPHGRCVQPPVPRLCGRTEARGRSRTTLGPVPITSGRRGYGSPNRGGLRRATIWGHIPLAPSHGDWGSAANLLACRGPRKRATPCAAQVPKCTAIRPLASQLQVGTGTANAAPCGCAPTTGPNGLDRRPPRAARPARSGRRHPTLHRRAASVPLLPGLWPVLPRVGRTPAPCQSRLSALGRDGEPCLGRGRSARR